MSSKPPTPTGIAGILQSETVDKFATFFLSRGGKATAVCLVVAILFQVGGAISDIIFLGFTRETSKEFATAMFWFAISMGWATLFWSGKRNRDMIATGVGEIKTDLPGPTTQSSDPGIQKVQEKIAAGVPSGGTSTGG